MYAITDECLTSLVFGVILFAVGITMLIAIIKDIIKYGADTCYSVLFILSLSISIIGIVMILTGLGILVIV